MRLEKKEEEEGKNSQAKRWTGERERERDREREALRRFGKSSDSILRVHIVLLIKYCITLCKKNRAANVRSLASSRG
jgi:hypothetical protein